MLRQVLQDVASVVDSAALDDDPFTEGCLDGLGQALRAVDHDQTPTLHTQTPLDQCAQESTTDGSDYELRSAGRRSIDWF